MPGYLNLWRFSHGILSQKHPWAVYEFKAMMKVMVGVLTGICPPEGLALLQEYFHIHCLSHYSVHSNESLEYLDSAISTFQKLLKAPNGPFIKNGLVLPDYEPQLIHYFCHYYSSIWQKGALTSYSTEVAETHHIALKRSWRRSNKRQIVSIEYVLKGQAILAWFQQMTNE